jgi:hypothetical protein
VVEPAASFVAQVAGRARTIYVRPENPANASSFTECHLGDPRHTNPALISLRLNRRNCASQSCPIQDEPEGEVGFQHKMSLERMAC